MRWHVLNLRILKSGGNGDVFVGERSDTGDQVVVKFLRESDSAFARKSFEREVRILTFGFPGMVRLLFKDMNAECPYYVMPYLVGGSLEKHTGMLTASQLNAVAINVAGTLAALHTANIAHGDIKPANVLAGHDGRLLVADPLGNGVGCTMLFSEHRGGTPGYWSPEVWAGGEISCSGDVYSFGVMLHELLTGRRPEDGVPLELDLASHIHAPLIRHLIAICCQSDPNARPTIQEVLHVLHGERWDNIQAARTQRQQVMVAAGFIGFALLVGAIFSADA